MSHEFNGVLLVDKPSGITSAQVVRAISRILGGNRSGHLGTLDPMATGLLVVFLGNALKTVPYHIKGRKRYVADIQFGSSTDTYDADGKVLETKDIPADLQHRINKALPKFLGTIKQWPPAYSAVKIQGNRAYSLARRGEEVEVPQREVTFYKIEPLMRRETGVVLDITCSAGTYIRSLAHDLGLKVGSLAHIASLRRLESHPFSVDNAIPFEAMKRGSVEPSEHILPIEDALPPLPQIKFSGDDAIKIRHGKRVFLDAGELESGIVLVMSPLSELVAIADYVAESHEIRVRRVVRPLPQTPAN